jgi:hypothetical protein
MASNKTLMILLGIYSGTSEIGADHPTTTYCGPQTATLSSSE